MPGISFAPFPCQRYWQGKSLVSKVAWNAGMPGMPGMPECQNYRMEKVLHFFFPKLNNVT